MLHFILILLIYTSVYVSVSIFALLYNIIILTFYVLLCLVAEILSAFRVLTQSMDL